ncbi:MAG: hypothetical protein NTV21_19615 [Planctomycetota bacterium]|nr:hypothetical protein [Planctomycetota bacterium]
MNSPTPQTIPAEPSPIPERSAGRPQPVAARPVRATPRSTLMRRERRVEQLKGLADALAETGALAWLSLYCLLESLVSVASAGRGGWSDLNELRLLPSTQGFTLACGALGLALVVLFVAWRRAGTHPVAAALLYLGVVWIAEVAEDSDPKPDTLLVAIAWVTALTVWRNLSAERVEVAKGELELLLAKPSLAPTSERIRTTLEATKNRRAIGWVEVGCALALACAVWPLLGRRAPSSPADVAGRVAWVLHYPQIKREILAENFAQPNALELATQLASEAQARSWKAGRLQGSEGVNNWPARYVGDSIEVRAGKDNPLVLAFALENSSWWVTGWRWDETVEGRR